MESWNYLNISSFAQIIPQKDGGVDNGVVDPTHFHRINQKPTDYLLNISFVLQIKYAGQLF